MNIPRSLAGAAKALGMDVQKDEAGYRVLMQMAKPRRARKGEDPSLIYRWEDDERRETLFAYCQQDVRVEKAIQAVLVPISASEREVWLMDQRMNNRGVFIDLELVGRLREIVEQAVGRLDRKIQELSHGQIPNVTSVARIKAYLSELGLDMESLDKASLRTTLEDETIPPFTRGILEVRGGGQDEHGQARGHGGRHGPR